jgi:two-component system, sensor histidine kinase and response regulator
MNDYAILIVDDQPENFEVIEALLEGTNYNLHYASSGRVAIDFLDKFDPDLILLDVMMPEVNGIEVCKQIKANSRWQAVPIIMVTSLGSKEDLASCLTAGADDFLSKPVNGIELRARVHSMLRIKKQHDRIEALLKLQRNSINSLKNSLHELNSDLAIIFPKESDAPVHNVLDKIHLLQQDFHKMPAPQVKEIMASISQSAIELDQFQQSFLFTRQLSSAIAESDKQQTCATKISIEQIAIRQIDQLQSPPQLIFDIEDADLAIKPKHLQYIIVELLDYILQVAPSPKAIHMYGHVIDDEFHFYLDNRGTALSCLLLEKLSNSISRDSLPQSAYELPNSLRIAQQIIEIHHGKFAIEKSNPTRTTVYITLPLTRLITSSKSIFALINEIGDSISGELQENFSR